MTSSLLNIGTRGLAAAQGQLATVGHNIANASTAGYSRQQAQQVAAAGEFTGAGFFGRGVDLTTVQRRYDRFLAESAASAAMQAAADGARADALEGLDAALAGGESGLGAGIDRLLAAAGDLANRPADAVTRQAFLAAVDGLATRATDLASRFDAMARQVDGQLPLVAGQVNDRLAEVRDLNEQISRAQALGQPPNDLLDRRDAAVRALGDSIALRAVPTGDGGLDLFTLAGAPLLVGQRASTLSAAADPAAPPRLALRLDIGGGLSQRLDADDLGGGRLQGLLRFRDEDLAAARSRLDTLAGGVAAAFNAVHAAGFDANGLAGLALMDVQRDAHGAFTGLASRGLTPAQVATAQSASPAPRSDNRNALALAALGDARDAEGLTFIERHAALIGEVGQRVQGVRQRAEASAAILAEAQSRHQSATGVNLDEEAADLLRFQQAYQASAKVIQASQALFDSLLSAVGR